ncbi:glutamate 5-kinase [Sporobacter termitidis DSM 10068]|uniref:Glutamate 5-kinase n=1 Tax=Sporobacter termitidis DSM 10068 TaxID=1123282 RepID=A0A1M5TMM6_9FIRM|nr:glutamate 5-kinase [Sporobacter termitidis]SHH51921.1 glutamate 5-kinase [Sporobacter termitidis DSM 10068]
MEKKRIVVKVGTSTLCHGGKGLNFRNIDLLARTLADIKNGGNEVILVSSGAIGAGCGKLHLRERPVDLRLKQAVAAVGQCELMHIYDKFFGEYGVTVGQILLTRDDVDMPNVKQNLLGTFESLLELGVIPVVNENDSVCIEEIESEHKIFGDNDTLSAVVAALVSADLLVLLSDIDGLYDCDPRKNGGARLIPVVGEIDASIIALAGGAGTDFGTGGMATKLSAAAIANENGIDMVITNGDNPQNLYDIIKGNSIGTLFKRKAL